MGADLDKEMRVHTKLNSEMGKTPERKIKRKEARKPKPTPASNKDGWEEVVDVEDLTRRLLELKACTV